MYNLKITVDEIKGFCDLPMKVGDYFEVKGGRIIIPEGKYICLWALQSMMPLLPLKQRQPIDENDWVPYTKKICCPDPNGLVIYRIETVDPETGMIVDESAVKSDNPRPRMLIDPDKCSGCRACETACSFSHTGSFCGENSRIKIDKVEAEGTDSPRVCRQCGNAPCIDACPNKALSKHPVTKAVIVDETKCTGCRACLKVCPFNCISFHNITHKALVCDLCGGSPECVKRCATGAIRYGNAGNLADRYAKEESGRP